MPNRGLLFIPDISGFTRFVNETEIEHSRLIIQELLEILIGANDLALEISEIEGDAILFYKFGASPDLSALFAQVKKMFYSFHRSLLAYEQRRFCHCKACKAAIELSLKVITHYGEFTEYNVKQFNKLIGRDIIVAHQLLKNEIEQHEYWLVTDNLLGDPSYKQLPPSIVWNSSSKKTESGDINFQYAQLASLKNEIAIEPLPIIELPERAKVIHLVKEFDTDIVTLFHATGDYNYRSQWQVGVTAVEEVMHFLPRVGMKTRVVRENGSSMVCASSYSYHPDKICFTETEEQTKYNTRYTLEKISEDRTRLSYEHYVHPTLSDIVYFRLFKKSKAEKDINTSLTNLSSFVKGLDFKVAD